MTTPRKLLVDPVVPLFYHVVSRCVRRSWLCGIDLVTGKNYKHRKKWLVDRLHFLAQYFAIEVHAYSIMSNHFHLVLFYDPKAHHRWTDEQVADRWLAVCPPRTWRGEIDILSIPVEKARILADPDRLSHVRGQLGSMSAFMKHLKQPIARRANMEDGCKGHFFEQRFYSGALLSERAIIAAMTYVDINPIRAKIAETLAQCEDTSIAERLLDLENSPEALEAALAPLVSGLEGAGRVVNITLRSYMAVAMSVAILDPDTQESSDVIRWQQDVASLAKRQRVYGPPDLVDAWIGARGMRMLEKYLAA